MCEQPLTATPRSSDPFPEAPVWNCLRVAKRQYKSKSRGSLAKTPHPKTQPEKQKLPESERNFISLNASWKGK